MEERLVLIDGNSILNRAFYGIMGSKTLMTSDGRYTNAVYGFLAIMFKILEDLNPKYLVVAFDMKGPTKRHEMYENYKATRKGMPDELAQQLPMIKEILKAMNIDVVEKQGYEGDDILGTLAKYGESQGLDVTILSGDRDNFQLVTDKITVRIPRTKMGKTETEDFNREKVKEVYGIEPIQLIEVKGLQGDTSDNIPGVPGIGEKTALKLIAEYGTIENLYNKLKAGETNIKGKQKENLENNEELAKLSKTLGIINTEVPIEDNLEDFKVEEWDRPEVLRIFKELKFNRYIERFALEQEGNIKENTEDVFKPENIKTNMQEIINRVKRTKKLMYYIETEENENSIEDKLCIINKKVKSISIYDMEKNEIYFLDFNKNQPEFIKYFKEIFENTEIEKYGYKFSNDYIILKQIGIKPENLVFDVEIAAYLVNPTNAKHTLEEISFDFLELDLKSYINNIIKEKKNTQINLFDIGSNQEENENKEKEKQIASMKVYVINNLYNKIIKQLKEMNGLELFKNIEMPMVEILAEMQYEGIHVDEEELTQIGNILKERLEGLTLEIYEIAGQEFNINSTKQLGEILFEKLKLPVQKKTKSGYSTDVDVLEKLKREHDIIPKILEYRQLMKLNSTYVEGLKPYINNVSKRIHSFFHQTITATGRLSSTEPNLQNIPTRIELGKKLRKVFEPEEGKVYIDADYSQIELRVLAHMSEDEHMIDAFNNDEDIHKQVASKVFNVSMDEVSKEQRSAAKAVNFGIVYGISDFGLSEQLGITRKKAKEYINQYLEKYPGIKQFMDNITEKAKEQGHVETLFKRRRYIPELKSSNYMVRQFGARAAMNTPVQGTAADIMKIAMINVYNELKARNLKSKIILQIHDELMIEALEKEKEEVKEILKTNMENAAKLKIPLKVELCEAYNWYDAK